MKKHPKIRMILCKIIIVSMVVFNISLFFYFSDQIFSSSVGFWVKSQQDADGVSCSLWNEAFYKTHKIQMENKGPQPTEYTTQYTYSFSNIFTDDTDRMDSDITSTVRLIHENYVIQNVWNNFHSTKTNKLWGALKDCFYYLNDETYEAELLYETEAPNKIWYGNESYVVVWKAAEQSLQWIDWKTQEVLAEQPLRLHTRLPFLFSYFIYYIPEDETIAIQFDIASFRRTLHTIPVAIPAES